MTLRHDQRAKSAERRERGDIRAAAGSKPCVEPCVQLLTSARAEGTYPFNRNRALAAEVFS
jgi:hypothetical protein